MAALEILHIVTPAVLSLPVLSLIPSHAAPSNQLDGVRPVTIQTVTPRRGLILLFLGILAATSVWEGLLLVFDLATSPFRNGTGGQEHPHSVLYLVAATIHAIGGVSVYSLAAILAEWRMRWGDKSLVLLGLLAWGLEVPNLVLTVIRQVHTEGTQKIFATLLIPPSCLRLLILPLLVVLVLNPIVRFEPADETTGLLADSEDGVENGGIPAARNNLAAPSAYGTFENDTDAASTHAGTATASPVPGQSPAANLKQLKIPKKLGEKKNEENEGISWPEFWRRLAKLSPHLWPSTSVKLQIYCLISVTAVLLSLALNPWVPLTLGRLVDALTAAQKRPDGTMPTDAPSPWPYLWTYLALRAIQGQGLLNVLQTTFWIPVQQYADREMQILLFSHLLDLSLAFHTKRNTGEVLKIIDRGSAINNLFQVMLFNAIPTILNIFIAFGVFFIVFDRWLALLLTIIMAFYVAFSITFTSYRTKLRREMRDRDIKTRGIASDVLTNWESVKYFTAEQRETARFTSSIISYQETEGQVLRSFNLLNMTQSFIIILGLLGGALIITVRISRGQARAGDFVAFTAYLQQLYAPLDRLGTLYRMLNQYSIEAEKLFSLLSEPTEITDKPGAKELVVTDGVIEFDDVHFSYDGKVQALKGVSFRIGKGESMALVGESGSGKSTILRLLYRFYDIDKGHIRIDGQDISEVTQQSLRRAIGIVPQDSVLWNDTIGSNISYGKEGASDEQIVAAAKAARLHDRILSFPEGYSTVVGERGVRLSGGEKQRVSLARMFLKSPAILVLDEATSALDTETEREIQRALADLSRDRSSLSIAHRLSTIINSDQIVVMKDGSVIEHGAYRDLLDLNGQFATMWQKQIHTEAEMRNTAIPNLLPLPASETASELSAEERGKGFSTPPAQDVDVENSENGKMTQNSNSSQPTKDRSS